MYTLLIAILSYVTCIIIAFIMSKYFAHRDCSKCPFKNNNCK